MAAAGAQGHLWTRRRLPSQPGVNLWVGIRIADLCPALMLTVPELHVNRFEELPVTEGLQLEASRLDGDPEGCCTLSATLRGTAYEDIFAVFCDDCARRLARSRTPEEAADTLLIRLRRWQRFLGQGRDGLSRKEETGLFGELHILLSLLLPAVGVAAISGWTGPDEAPQDFVVGAVAVEVKTTTSNVMSQARISSERQLDDTGLESLFLVCLRLETAVGGRTLNDLVGLLRSIVSADPEARAELEDRLHETGYFDRHRGRYDARRYRAAEQATYLVQGQFPRIVASTCPSGTGRVSYDLALASCRQHAVSESRLTDALRSADTA